MKKLFALLMCVAVLIATFSSCDASDVFDEIVDTSPHTDSEDTPKPAEKIPSGFVFTPLEDGTCGFQVNINNVALPKHFSIINETH